MQVDIEVVSRCLFSSAPQALDLNTGDTIFREHLNKTELRSGRYRALPLYSDAPIYRQYLEMVRDRLRIDVDEALFSDPRYELIPLPEFSWTKMTVIPQEEQEFIERAYEFSESLEEMLREERQKPNPQVDPAFPTLSEYMDQTIEQIGMEWCEKEGYQ